MICDPVGAEAHPVVPTVSGRALVARLEASPTQFAWDPSRAGVDCRCCLPVNGEDNRARIKVFEPDHRTTVAFLYKDSLLPFSKDRFAYGAAVWKEGGSGLLPGEADGLLAYLESGLHPEKRPEFLRRAFPFDVPK